MQPAYEGGVKIADTIHINECTEHDVRTPRAREGRRRGRKLPTLYMSTECTVHVKTVDNRSNQYYISSEGDALVKNIMKSVSLRRQPSICKLLPA